MENLLITLILNKIDKLEPKSITSTNLIIRTPNSIIEFRDCHIFFEIQNNISIPPPEEVTDINRYLMLKIIRPKKSSSERTRLKRKLKL